MNLLISFVLVLCLLISEVDATRPVENVWIHLAAMLTAALLVPGLAAFQTAIATRRIRLSEWSPESQQTLISRLSIVHLAVWLMASLAIVWVAGWQNVVRGNWELHRWPLLDELVILSPMVLSMVTSWAVFFEIQRSLESQPIKSVWRARFDYVSVRFRIYFLLLLVPLAVAATVRDLAWDLEKLSLASALVYFGLGIVFLLAVFPFIMSAVWNGKRMSDSKLKKRLLQVCDDHCLNVYDVRMWETGNQVINAVVAGVIPKLRIVMLSDALLKNFPERELVAVLRHEAGHVRLWHLPIRICFIILPLLMLGALENSRLNPLSGIQSVFAETGWDTQLAWILVTCLYIAYLTLTLSWLSRNMEFEADMYAIGFDKLEPGGHEEDLAQAMSDALLRFAAFSPDQLERRTLLHPSIRQRLDLITAVRNSPGRVELFRTSFLRRQTIMLLVLSALTLLALLL